MEYPFVNCDPAAAESESHASPWYYSQKFSKFWESYSRIMYYAHKDALLRCNEVADNTAAALNEMITGPRHGRIHKKRNKQKKKRRKHKTKELFVLSDDDTLQVSRLAAGMQLNDSQNDVDEEYLAFMEQTLKHRLQWKKNKALKQREAHGIEANSEPNVDQIIAPNIIEEHPDDIRNREMQQMYGSFSTQIHAMETAMQLSFDRESTLYNPTLWPNIPLRLSFS